MSNHHIVSSSGIVGLVGGARIERADIAALLPLVAEVVAADGGADHLLAAGLMPSAVIGDMDSISDRARAAFAEQMYHIAEQETTDFEKALSRIDAACVLALGFTGGRMDHALAVLNVLARNRARPVVLLDGNDASFMLPDAPVELIMPPGARISLMPLADVQVTATGLRWPLTDAALHPSGSVSASNAVADEKVSLRASGPLLVTLPRAHLGAALKAVVPAR